MLYEVIIGKAVSEFQSVLHTQSTIAAQTTVSGINLNALEVDYSSVRKSLKDALHNLEKVVCFTADIEPEALTTSLFTKAAILDYNKFITLLDQLEDRFRNRQSPEE